MPDPANELTLDPLYQPYPAGTPGPLQCYRFTPGSAAPDAKLPTVLMVPPNIFKNDRITDEGEPSERVASYDLAQAGFLVFQVDTRLAPPGSLPDQAGGDLGHAPEQTDDLKRQILSALADRQCNGNIYLVGGSAGGTLALWCALDPAATVPGWNETVRKKIKAVVSMSGPAQFCDWDNPGNLPADKLTDFENDLNNYVGIRYGTPNCDPNCTGDVTCALNTASPAWLVTHGATSSPPPIMLYATNGDPVPNKQARDMYAELTGRFPALEVDLSIMSYPLGSRYDHAFKYWHAVNDSHGPNGPCVSDEVINFLKAH